jgi:hypothetical protein
LQLHPFYSKLSFSINGITNISLLSKQKVIIFFLPKLVSFLAL